MLGLCSLIYFGFRARSLTKSGAKKRLMGSKLVDLTTLALLITFWVCGDILSTTVKYQIKLLLSTLHIRLVRVKHVFLSLLLVLSTNVDAELCVRSVKI